MSALRQSSRDRSRRTERSDGGSGEMEAGQVDVTFDENKVSVSDIKDAIEDQGYDVV